MSERPDPFEILQEIHPVVDRGRLEPGQLPHADALLTQIVEGDMPVPRRVQLGRVGRAARGRWRQVSWSRRSS